MLLQGASPATEDAHGLRLRQEDDVVLDGDLERILLAQREPIYSQADLIIESSNGPHNSAVADIITALKTLLAQKRG